MKRIRAILSRITIEHVQLALALTIAAIMVYAWWKS